MLGTGYGLFLFNPKEIYAVLVLLAIARCHHFMCLIWNGKHPDVTGLDYVCSGCYTPNVDL
jgi:hypothetical protein